MVDWQEKETILLMVGGWWVELILPRVRLALQA